MPLDVYFLPASASPENLAQRTVVVIDVLRATTTITQALAAGAREVIPCSEVEEARGIAEQLPGCAVLGGERHGRRINGFDLGNSPAEYTRQTVGGKTLVFTTTNGTRAMQSCRGARRVLLGAFGNLSALVESLRTEDEFVLLCAGTLGHVTREDVLFAGAVIHRLLASGPVPQPWNDEACLALSAWNGILPGAMNQETLRDALLDSRGGRNLIALGMEADVAIAARIDTTKMVPELQLASWRILPLDHRQQC
jgi:2-phosphosulfolactate phosphatase